MGYTFRIGEPILSVGLDNRIRDLPYAHIEVAHRRDAQAPYTGENQLSPSYNTTWSDFCRDVGLYEVFFGAKDERGNNASEWSDLPILISNHPGAAFLYPEHLAAFEQAEAAFRGKHCVPETRPPDDAPEADLEVWYDAQRLAWLIYWTRDALQPWNHNPVFYNR